MYFLLVITLVLFLACFISFLFDVRSDDCVCFCRLAIPSSPVPSHAGSTLRRIILKKCISSGQLSVVADVKDRRPCFLLITVYFTRVMHCARLVHSASKAQIVLGVSICGSFRPPPPFPPPSLLPPRRRPRGIYMRTFTHATTPVVSFDCRSVFHRIMYGGGVKLPMMASQEDVGYVVGKFPEEKQVVATSTVEASSIEEGLCALLGVPELHRIGTDGSVRKSGVRMPSCSPPPRAPTTGVPDRRLPSQGHVRAAGEALASRGPGAPMTLALTAKERLLEETRNALRISTARVVASSSGGGKARSPSSVTSDSRLTGTPKSFDRAPPPYSSVSSGMFSNCLSSKSNERVLSGAAWRRNSAGAKVGGNAGACGCDAGLLGALGAQDDDCASTLDLLSPGALHGSEGMRAGIVSGAVVNPATAAVANRGGRSSKPAGLARVPEHREQRHHDGQRDDGQHQPFVDSPAAGTASLEELDIPPVLLASLAAEGVTAPTPLQASVWTAGRGSRREDLLVHVSGHVLVSYTSFTV